MEVATSSRSSGSSRVSYMFSDTRVDAVEDKVADLLLLHTLWPLVRVSVSDWKRNQTESVN